MRDKSMCWKCKYHTYIGNLPAKVAALDVELRIARNDVLDKRGTLLGDERYDTIRTVAVIKGIIHELAVTLFLGKLDAVISNELVAVDRER